MHTEFTLVACGVQVIMHCASHSLLMCVAKERPGNEATMSDQGNEQKEHNKLCCKLAVFFFTHRTS